MNNAPWNCIYDSFTLESANLVLYSEVAHKGKVFTNPWVNKATINPQKTSH